MTVFWMEGRNSALHAEYGKVAAVVFLCVQDRGDGGDVEEQI